MHGLVWRILPAAAPEFPARCSHCTHPSLACTGRFRVNSSAALYDIWLIYRCAACGRRWKRSIERRVSRDRLGSRLDGYRADDPHLVLRHAFAGVTPKSPLPYRVLHVPGSANPRPEAERKAPDTPGQAEAGPSATLELAGPDWVQVEQPFHCGVRWDRLLARELGWSRARIDELWRSGRIELAPERKLRARVRDGDRARIADLAAVDLAAVGPWMGDAGQVGETPKG